MKCKNLFAVKSILKSIQRFARYKILALISIGRLCCIGFNLPAQFYTLQNVLQIIYTPKCNVLQGTVGRVFYSFSKRLCSAIVVVFWLKLAGYLAVAGLNILG